MATQVDDIIKPGARRTRPRRELFRFERAEIGARIRRFYTRDLGERELDRDARLQRYAKFRMWSEGKDWPWEDCSDIPLPDLQEKSLRLQDTLVNAVMSQRPVIGAKTIGARPEPERERIVDRLIDHQVFVEQPGEEIVGEAADAFCNDGVVTAFVPWVREVRDTVDSRRFPPIPDELEPAEYFEEILNNTFPAMDASPLRDGWDWRLRDERESFEARFYTGPEDAVEMVVKRETIVHDGPRIMILDYEDILHPARAANLQPRGPSNPNGAGHVIVRTYPAVDEIRRLARAGFYDLITREEAEALENYVRQVDDDAEEEQRDAIAGRIEDRHESPHGTLTRLMVFDQYDVDGDGLAEDVIWWYLVEPQIVIKAKLLTESFPSNPPRRPFAEAAMIPVRGRRIGIGVLEQLEGLHDAWKTLIDQGIDAGTLTNLPFGFYRPQGGMNPEIMRLWPGELYPLANPAQDVFFPQLNGQGASAFTLNMGAMVGQMEERLTQIGPLQLGRIPAGASSALRTSGNLAAVQSEGEARPERILRRFFMFWAQVWQTIHALNENFLPDRKQVRIVGWQRPEEDPYFEVPSREAIQGRYSFSFQANVLNTSKFQFQQSLQALLATLVNPLMLQAGIVTPENIYDLATDFAIAHGADPLRYISPPSVDAGQPRILAEEVVSEVMENRLPDGNPLEPAEEHLQKLQEFMASDDFGLLEPAQVRILAGWVQKVQRQAAQAALARSAQTMQAGPAGQQNPGGRPAESIQAPQAAPVQENELTDESLPTAGGGAQGR